MRIDGLNPLPAVSVPETQAPAPAQGPQEAKANARSQESVPTPKDEVTQHVSSPDPLSVVVEMQSGNRLVYKFIDQANGEVIQQIPSETMLRMAEAIESTLKAIYSKAPDTTK